MTCDICKREVLRLRGLVVDGKVVMGCKVCFSDQNPSRISTDKRWYHGQGYDFWASPAHLDHIRHRRVCEDGVGVEQNRR